MIVECVRKASGWQDSNEDSDMISMYAQPSTFALLCKIATAVCMMLHDNMISLCSSIIVGAPRGNRDPPPPQDDNLYNLPYGVVYNCPVNPGVCEGLIGGEAAGERLYDNTGMQICTCLCTADWPFRRPISVILVV